MPHISVGDFRLYYEELAPARIEPSRPPIIFLHGFTLDRRMWSAQAAPLAQTRRVILLDARGHGLSDAPPTGYSRADRVDDLVSFVDKMSIATFHLVGLSMGGSTGIGYALRDQSRLASLTLASTGAAGWNIGKKISRIDTLARERGLDAAREQWIAGNIRFYTEAQREIGQLVETMMREHSGAPWMDLRRGNYPSPGNDLDRVHTITAPTLIIAGRKDKVFVPLAHLLAERIPDTRLTVYDDAGHMVNLEAPERFNADLAAFLDEVESR